MKAGDATLEPGAPIGERFKHGDAVSFEVPKWPWGPWRVTFFGAISRDFKGFHHGNLGLTMDLSISRGNSLDLYDYDIN